MTFYSSEPALVRGHDSLERAMDYDIDAIRERQDADAQDRYWGDDETEGLRTQLMARCAQIGDSPNWIARIIQDTESDEPMFGALFSAILLADTGSARWHALRALARELLDGASRSLIADLSEPFYCLDPQDIEFEQHEVDQVAEALGKRFALCGEVA